MLLYALRVYPKGLSRQVSRTIELTGDHTLDDLCHAFLHSIDFDDDHLYEFLFSPRLYVRNAPRYVCRNDGWTDDPTTDVCLDDVGLAPGENIYLHYDFGDDWLFTIHVNKVTEVSDRVPARVVAAKGTLVQYPSWDDADTWDE